MYKVMSVVLAGAMLMAVPVFAAEEQTDANMEILMQKIKADKKLLVASNMDLTDAEAKQFWPVYESYQKDLEGVNQQLGKTIAEYAKAFNKGSISNDTSKKLLNEALTIEEQETKLKRTYADKLGKILSANKVARYLQIETKVRSLIKFEMAQQIPLVY